jgi:hypothetical protein
LPDELTLEKAKIQIAGLIEENRRLAAELEGLREQAAGIAKAVRGAQAGQAAAAKEAGALRSQLAAAKARVTELEASRRVLNAEAARLRLDPKRNPPGHVTPEEASVLLDNLIAPFRAAEGFAVRNVDLTLRLGAARVGNQTVLVIPPPGAADAGIVQEVKISLEGQQRLAGALERTATPAPDTPAPAAAATAETAEPAAKTAAVKTPARTPRKK